MKNSISRILFVAGLAGILTGCSSNEDLLNPDIPSQAASKEASKSKTYTIRYGLLSQNGTPVLSGSYDIGSFVATNTVTGESFETYAGSGLQSLPKYSEGVPAGTYIFTATQGQGGWVGYGSVTGVVSDVQIDQDGYITVYVPIAWEE
ncbi:hypothetical protein SD427_15555 [Chryseobacterium sp. JJR-5R]|uniref:hypothetical protein n=1 Tax=Chryseobacterium sp. JJR-5R TaxID=3093923 RepID=UPI002A75D44D|nr:hypothetical protein [Chryseobacterium sp. JJR-5R]WPO82171.1 hypothetical protein SD427_15555 [Chryseobacterium sp. JJR-5R]